MLPDGEKDALHARLRRVRIVQHTDREGIRRRKVAGVQLLPGSGLAGAEAVQEFCVAAVGGGFRGPGVGAGFCGWGRSVHTVSWRGRTGPLTMRVRYQAGMRPQAGHGHQPGRYHCGWPEARPAPVAPRASGSGPLGQPLPHGLALPAPPSRPPRPARPKPGSGSASPSASTPSSTAADFRERWYPGMRLVEEQAHEAV
jgi:hypothetical protein